MYFVCEAKLLMDDSGYRIVVYSVEVLSDGTKVLSETNISTKDKHQTIVSVDAINTLLNKICNKR